MLAENCQIYDNYMGKERVRGSKQKIDFIARQIPPSAESSNLAGHIQP